MAITVDDYAMVDPRFDALGKALRCHRDSALVRMMRVWQACTQLGTDRLSVQILAPSLRCKPERVVEVLEVAELGEELEDGTVRIRGTNEKRTGWKAKLLGEAEDGGQARAAASVRQGDGTFAAKERDLQAEILAALRAGPMSRSKLSKALRCRKGAVLEIVRDLLDRGIVEELDGGRLSYTGDSTCSHNLDTTGSAVPWNRSAEPVHGASREPVHGTAEPLRGTSALTPAPAPACVPPSGGTAPAEPVHGASREPVHGTAEPATAEPRTRVERRDASYLLANEHDRLGQEVAASHGLKWRSLQTAGPKLWAPVLLDGATVDDCRHVLAMLAAEADERCTLGVAAPLDFLRRPTSTEIWTRAMGWADEEEAREYARARARAGGGKQPTPPEQPRKLKRLA